MADQAPALEPSPEKIWQLLHGYQKTATLKAAIDLDIFTAIASGANTVEKIADRVQASPRGIRILCDYLTVDGLLHKDGNTYGLPLESELFLNRQSPTCICSAADFLTRRDALEGVAELTAIVRAGTIPQRSTVAPEYEGWEVFAESMVPLVAGAVQFMGELAVAEGRQPKKVLDIAASHGLFGIEVAKRSPKAEIVAVDWPNVLRAAERNAKKAGVDQRVRLVAGDAFAVNYGNGYDLVLLTNFLHHFDEERCVELLRKIYAAMEPGGRLFTLEFCAQ